MCVGWCYGSIINSKAMYFCHVCLHVVRSQFTNRNQFRGTTLIMHLVRQSNNYVTFVTYIDATVSR
jgi:hypothetical protein